MISVSVLEEEEEGNFDVYFGVFFLDVLYAEKMKKKQTREVEQHKFPEEEKNRWSLKESRVINKFTVKKMRPKTQ